LNALKEQHNILLNANGAKALIYLDNFYPSVKTDGNSDIIRSERAP